MRRPGLLSCRPVRWRRWLVFALAAAWLGPVSGADLVREGRLAMELEDSPVEGQGQWLKSGDVSFYGLLLEPARPNPEGAVLILPGSQAGPNQAGLIRALRTGLPARGWITLAIQTPMAPQLSARAQDALLIEESLLRIRFAVETLRQRKIENIVILGFDLGGQMGLGYLAGEADQAVRGLVMVSTPAYPGADADAPVTSLPVLDLLGQRDRERIVLGARMREGRFRRLPGSNYRLVTVSGADHQFRQLEPGMVSRVAAWIKRVAPGTALPNGAVSDQKAPSGSN